MSKMGAAGKEEGLLVLEAVSSMDFLMKLARGYLKQFDAIAIGITGSLGKTTTRSFITSILSRGFNIIHTPRNYNTEIGVSKTILSIGKDTDFFVAELGMRGAGQIKPLAEVCNIGIGAITSISGSHMEFFESIEGLAAAKAEIASPISKNGGKLFLNADDEMTPFIKDLVDADSIEFGENAGRDYNFIKTGSDNRGRYSFSLFKKDKKIADIKCSQPGYHNMYNGCLAAAICHYLGADAGMIREGLENAQMEEHRMQVLEYKDYTILDDCYNASPVSVEGALDTLDLISGKNKRRSVAILGDMKELGKSAEELHVYTGKYAAKKDIDVLVTSGKLAKNMCRGFKEDQESCRCCHSFDDSKKVIGGLENIIEPGDVILVKGSRANKLEDIVEHLKKLYGK
jgi:UDP-N-acetylmuramoyl-tripeptide--D-alanyl-D-alanine ligase